MEIEKVFANAFRSDRLIYRDVEKSDTDKEWMYKFGPGDHVAWGLGNPMLFKDVAKKQGIDHAGTMIDQDILLRVLICLPADESAEEAVETAKLGLGQRAAKERANATPVGILTLAPVKLGHGFTRIGISIGEQHQNKGYGPEAINWAVDWAFKFAGVHKVEIGTASYNERAAKLYPKLGFTPEGRRREVVYMNGKWYDMFDFGILEHEWRKLRELD